MAQQGLNQASTQLGHRRLSVAMGAVMLVMAQALSSSVAMGVVSEPQSSSSRITRTNHQPSTLRTSTTTKLRSRGEARWKMSLSGESFVADVEQAQTAGFSLQGDFSYRLLNAVSLQADLGARLQSGYSQSRFGENTPRTGLDLYEAVVEFRPLRAFKVQAGAVSNSIHDAPLLVSRRAFPGVSETIEFSNRNFGIEFRAQQTVPTSSTLSTRTVDAEPMPTFMTETLALKAETKDVGVDSIKARIYGMHYAFADLPSSVAIESEPHGNSILELGPNSSRFRFDFDGWVAGAESQVDFSRTFSMSVDGQMLQNLKADATYQNAQLTQMSMEVRLRQGIDLRPKAGVFFAESDVAPAFYNSAEFGHGNRQGWLAELKVVFREAGFSLGGRYVTSELINPNLLQSRQSYAMLKFETLYGAL